MCESRVSHRHARGHAGFFVANAVLSRDPWSQGTAWWRVQVARPRGTRQGAHPQKYQKGTAADASPRTRGPDGSSWAADACDTRRKFPWSAQRFSILARPSALTCVSCAANTPLNIQTRAHLRPTPKEALPRLVRAAPPRRRSNRPEIRLCLLGGRAAPPRRRRGAAASGVAAHNVTSEKTARQKARAAALPERAREQNFREPTNSPIHARRRHTQLFTPLCAWKRAQNLAFSRTSHS